MLQKMVQYAHHPLESLAEGPAGAVRGSSLGEMSLLELSECSASEMRKYRSKEPCNDLYCLEILRRAVVQRNSEAWAVLQQQLSENVRLWVDTIPFCV